MAEERIAIKVVSDPCDGCPKEHLCENDCISRIIYKNWGNCIPRQDVINRMAKAIRKKLFKNEGPTQKIKEQWLEKAYYEYVDFYCTSIAEAALNALLEVGK